MIANISALLHTSIMDLLDLEWSEVEAWHDEAMRLLTLTMQAR